MITITADFIDNNWSAISEGRVCPISLVAWDDGDAYTQLFRDNGVENSILGALVLADRPVSDFAIVVRFTKDSVVNGDTAYEAPDGGKYRVTGEFHSKMRKETLQVSIPQLRPSLNSRRAGLLEPMCLPTEPYVWSDWALVVSISP